MKILISSLLLASSVIHASCGDLDIKVINNSTHNCTFKNKVTYYGTLYSDRIPAEIFAGQSSPVFTATQDNVGVGVYLTYMCDNETVKFYSWQEYCGFLTSGNIGGQPSDSTTLSLDYSTESGSYIFDRSGKITWYIS